MGERSWSRGPLQRAPELRLCEEEIGTAFLFWCEGGFRGPEACAGQPHLSIIFQARPLHATFQMVHFYGVQRAPSNARRSVCQQPLPSLPGK